MSAGSSIQVGGTTLRVPTHIDEKTTQTIASRLQSRYESIEDNAERIDSLGFLLRLAYDLAVELHEHKSQSDEDLKALLVHMDRLKGRLERLSERLDNPPTTPRSPDDATEG
jgi:hypothetical protein